MVVMQRLGRVGESGEGRQAAGLLARALALALALALAPVHASVPAGNPCDRFGYLREDRAPPCARPPSNANASLCCLQWKEPASSSVNKQVPITFYDKMGFASGYDVRYAHTQLNRAYKGGFLPNVTYTWDVALASSTIAKRWRGLWDQCVTGKPMWDHSDAAHADLRKDMAHQFIQEQYENHGRHCLDFVVPIYGMWSGFRDIQASGLPACLPASAASLPAPVSWARACLW